MKPIQLLFAAITLTLFVQCENHPSTERLDIEDSEGMAVRLKTADPVETNKKLIKKGRISFESEDLVETRNQIIASISEFDGYISSEEENNYSGQKSITIEARIPAKAFDQFVSQATVGVEQFDERSIDIQDVTEQFLDVEARLKAKKELEARYIQILSKANIVSEILEIEKEISILRTEIESIEGKLNFLKNQTTYSTVNFHFYIQTLQEKTFGNKFNQSLSNGWDALVTFLLVIVSIWPFILILILVVVVLRKYQSKKHSSN